MSDASYNPYQAPAADVGSISSTNDEVMHFKRFSAWGVFGLSIITLGIYPIYWLYSRATTLNTFHARKIEPGLIYAFIILALISFGTNLVPMPDDGAVFLIAMLNIAYFVCYLMVLFGFRNRLNEMTVDNISGLLTFFFSAIYLQYKINCEIDKSNSF